MKFPQTLIACVGLFSLSSQLAFAVVPGIAAKIEESAKMARALDYGAHSFNLLFKFENVAKIERASAAGASAEVAIEKIAKIVGEEPRIQSMKLSPEEIKELAQEIYGAGRPRKSDIVAKHYLAKRYVRLAEAPGGAIVTSAIADQKRLGELLSKFKNFKIEAHVTPSKTLVVNPRGPEEATLVAQEFVTANLRMETVLENTAANLQKAEENLSKAANKAKLIEEQLAQAKTEEAISVKDITKLLEPAPRKTLPYVFPIGVSK